MFRTFFKFLFFIIFLTFLVVAIALIAAPYFVRQDQVRAFIEKNISLPDDKKLELPEKIEFGLFPYMHFETAKLQIVGDQIPSQTFEKVKFGFDFNDLFGNSVDFDVRTRYQGVDYDANIDIIDYKGFYQNGATPVVIKAVSPVPFKLKGDLRIEDESRSLKNFVLNHKKTTAKGTVKHSLKGAKSHSIEGNVVIDTDNVDDLRRLAVFEKYSDTFNLLEGAGKLVVAFSTTGYDSYTYKKNLDAEGTFKFSEMTVYGFDLDEIARNPFQVKFVEDYSRRIDIDSVTGLFTTENGLMKLTDAKAQSKRINILSNGLVNVADENMNLDVDLDLNLETKKVNVPLKVKGNFDKPKVTPRYDETIKNNLPALLEGQDLRKGIDKDKLKENFKQIEDDFKNLFRGFKR